MCVWRVAWSKKPHGDIECCRRYKIHTSQTKGSRRSKEDLIELSLFGHKQNELVCFLSQTLACFLWSFLICVFKLSVSVIILQLDWWPAGDQRATCWYARGRFHIKHRVRLMYLHLVWMGVSFLWPTEVLKTTKWVWEELLSSRPITWCNHRSAWSPEQALCPLPSLPSWQTSLKAWSSDVWYHWLPFRSNSK